MKAGNYRIVFSTKATPCHGNTETDVVIVVVIVIVIVTQPKELLFRIFFSNKSIKLKLLPQL